MSFGYSVGDLLGVITLATNLIRALNESRGVSVELRRLVETLASLERAVNNAIETAKEWDLAHPNPGNKAPFNALIEEHRICQRLLENFMKDLEKYTHRIVAEQGPQPGSRVKREWAKIKWFMLRSDDIVEVEQNLRIHMMAIDMYCCELRL
ncbi:hypothetical protein K440DRAFT_467586, partial [Wilcoxina mikolae CBS 423.85]